MTLLTDPPQTTSSFIPSAQLAAAPRHVPGARRLIDSYGRQIKDLRISVTDRCNFRCVYCMPEEGMQWLKRESIMSFDEIERIARVAVELGVDEIRLTGGEPTLRPGLPELVARVSQLPLRSLSLTTNGFLLRSMAKPLAEAGLKRINVSLDTLQHDRFHQIARRHGLDEVLAGLEELEKYPSVAPIKVNVVAMRDFTESEVVDFARLARRKPYVIRFIEFMPLDADGNWQREQVLHAHGAGARRGEQYLAPLHVRRWHRRARLHQSRVPAVLRHVQSHSTDRRRSDSHVPVLDRRVGCTRRAAPRGQRRPTCGPVD
jgi:molybdenum cofactor biosynthesis protein A